MVTIPITNFIGSVDTADEHMFVYTIYCILYTRPNFQTIQT